MCVFHINVLALSLKIVSKTLLSNSLCKVRNCVLPLLRSIGRIAKFWQAFEFARTLHQASVTNTGMLHLDIRVISRDLFSQEE